MQNTWYRIRNNALLIRVRVCTRGPKRNAWRKSKVKNIPRVRFKSRRTELFSFDETRSMNGLVEICTRMVLHDKLRGSSCAMSTVKFEIPLARRLNLIVVNCRGATRNRIRIVLLKKFEYWNKRMSHECSNEYNIAHS